MPSSLSMNMLSKRASLGLENQPLLRFLIVGGGVFIFDASVFFWLVKILALPLLPARVAAFAAAVILSWFVNRYWTFRGRHQAPHMRQLFMSMTVGSIAAMLNLSVFYLLTFLLGWGAINTFISFASGVLAGLIINWLGANYWSFKGVKAD